jgi:hypothetical protein
MTLRAPVRRALAGLAGAALLVLASAPLALADDTATGSLEAQLAVTDDGLIVVRNTLTIDGTAPATITQAIATSVETGDGRELIYTLSDIENATAATSGGVTTLTIDSADGTAEWNYTVSGATVENSDGSQRVEWSVAQGFSLGVTSVTGTFELPGGITSYICEGGTPGALVSCNWWSGGLHGSLALEFEYSRATLESGQVVNVGAVLEAGAVTVTAQYRELWSLGRAFQPSWAHIGAAVAILAVGGLALFGVARRQLGRLANAEPKKIAELAPDGEGNVTFNVHDRVRPGMVGTLIDQSVDPSDIVASLLDLSVRGHLLITELPRASASAVPDWTLTRRDSEDPLDDYEVQLLDAVAAEGTVTAVSQLTAAIAPAIGQVQDALYDRVVKAGWFARHPAARNPWLPLAWAGIGVAVVVTALLVAFTTWGLAGLALIAVALFGLMVAQDVPLITEEGSSVLAGLGDLSADLHNAPAQLPPGQEYQEASEILPYAIVLGGWDRWLEALVAADVDEEADAEDLDWYHAHDNWYLQELPVSLDAFITVVTGRLFTRA